MEGLFKLLRSRFAALLAVSLVCAAVFGVWMSGQGRLLSLVQGAGPRFAVVDGEEYRIGDEGVSSDTGILRRARVLRVALERTAAERTPLLALPGTDPEALLQSVEALEEARDALAFAQRDQKEAVAVRAALYPSSTLRALAKLESSRRSFVRSGSEEDMHSFLDAERNALRALRADLARFRREARRYAEGEEKHFLAGWVVSSSDFHTALRRLAEGASRAERSRLARRACARGLSFFCDRAIVERPALPALKNQSVGDEEKARARVVRALLSEIFSAPHILRSPIFAPAESACAEGEPPLFVLYDERMPEGFPPARRVALASDMRLLSTERLRSVPFYENLYDDGVHFVPASPLLHYACMYAAEDSARIFALDMVRTLAATTPLSAYAEAPENARSVEKALAGDIVLEKDARDYLSIGRVLAESGRLPGVVERAVDDSALALAYGSAGLPDMLAILAKTEFGDAGAFQDGVNADLTVPNLFFTRSAAQTTFVIHHPSFGNAKVFDLARAPIRPPRSPYVFLSQTDMSREFLARVVADARRFVRILGHPLP